MSGELKKWKFKLYKTNKKTKEVELTATCVTRPMTKAAAETTCKIELTKYKYDFWEFVL